MTKRDTALPEHDALLCATRRNSVEKKGREASVVALKAFLSNSRSLDEMSNLCLTLRQSKTGFAEQHNCNSDITIHHYSTRKPSEPAPALK